MSMCSTLNIATGVHNQAQISEIYGRLPLSFEANGGQSDGQVNFVARGSGYTLFLASAEAVLRLGSVGAQREGGLETAHNRREAVLRWQLLGAPGTRGARCGWGSCRGVDVTGSPPMSTAARWAGLPLLPWRYIALRESGDGDTAQVR
jgi:hypothetical protein